MRYWLVTAKIYGFEHPQHVLVVNSSKEMASAAAYWLFIGYFDYIDDLSVEIETVVEVPDFLNKVFS